MPKYRVRFYREVTTTDRHSIVVEAGSPDAARERVRAWGGNEIDLTDEEVLTEQLEKEGDVIGSEFVGLAGDDDPYEVEETDADGFPIN